ncbi:DUF4340 domain-containing protein [Aetokthonos hydrillicola Thurmond2011]|jgi:hypothetical protein|uniref:DUF4340 domain-containing protein n=1 Tax=Aetokthonos hydrillicola Thurmond2011 TaxID=2712845 RepID=A0AAP5IE26_9CYAN|nr:DUF4340 domain-containing protein [Aetokthonos hydrillicola]MBO3457878.1 DUF4340 domain-containing protein [Aetokthonos hydrillicola CCALA 1050]MBW4587364.1 DUF4340 domain-containing protein [Aetokthonos hydrillicola CCALA 1050]MDR9899933.1 DUF4340 domain-containing protein [Aetokthonos hydrillicola Thurmond2011]
MKLQRTTLILILLALGLGGFVYFYEIKGATQREEIKEKKQQIFSFGTADLQSLIIKTQNLSINLERQNNKWMLQSPEVMPANDAVVSYLTNLLVKGKSERTLLIPANQLGEFGLDQPQATIDVKLKNQKTHKLILGKPDFNQHFLYAMVDPIAKPSGSTNVLLVSKDFENAVRRDLSEWKEIVPIGSQNPVNKTEEPAPTKTK